MSAEKAVDNPQEATTGGRSETNERPPSESHAEDISRLESRLQTETQIRREAESEVTRLKGVVSDLNRNNRRISDDCAKKDDTTRQLETMIQHEQNQQQQLKEEWESSVQDRDNQIEELRRCLDSQRRQMGQALEEHSRAGQDLSQILEKERREWTIAVEMLQSELYGTQQLNMEFQSVQAEAHERQGSLEAQLIKLREDNRRLTSLNAELTEENQELRNSTNNDSDQLISIYEKEIEQNVREIADLKQRMSKFNDRLEEDYQRTDAQMADLRNKLAIALQERDRLATEVHSLTEKQLRRKSVRSSSLSSTGAGNESALAFSEKFSPSDVRMDELRFEIEEERRTVALVREQMDEQLQRNRELEEQIDNLKQELFQIPFSSFSRQYQRSDMEIIQRTYETVSLLKETLDSVHRIAREGHQREGAHHLITHQPSSLNISIEEARHQIDTIKSTLEPILGDSAERTKTGTSSRRLLPIGKKSRSRASIGSWNFKNFSSKHKTLRVEELKEQMEDMRRELATLMHDKFSLEQCVRYLSSRCQMYQLAWKAREGPQSSYSRVAPALNRTEVHDEIQPAERDEREAQQQQQGIATSHSMESAGGSSRAGGDRGDASPRLPRNLEMKLVNKIAQVCDPYTIQHSDTSRVGTISRPRSSRGVAV